MFLNSLLPTRQSERFPCEPCPGHSSFIFLLSSQM